MYVYIYIYKYIYICMHVCIYVCMYVCMCVYVCVCMNLVYQYTSFENAKPYLMPLISNYIILIIIRAI